MAMPLLPASRFADSAGRSSMICSWPDLEPRDARARLLDELKSTVSNQTSLLPPKPFEPL